MNRIVKDIILLFLIAFLVEFFFSVFAHYPTEIPWSGIGFWYLMVAGITVLYIYRNRQLIPRFLIFTFALMAVSFFTRSRSNIFQFVEPNYYGAINTIINPEYSHYVLTAEQMQN